MHLTSHILMIRPASFGFNEQTAVSNTFQVQGTSHVHQKALDEFDAMVNLLEENGIDVSVVDDTAEPKKPDAVFPNNWVSFHENGEVMMYPMQAENRRLERREEVIAMIGRKFKVQKITDFSIYEKENKFLEGTGSMVLDHNHKICYACISARTNIELVNRFCKHFGYQSVTFTARDNGGLLIYHTNVVMCAGEEFMVVCMDAIADAKERELIRTSTKKVIIEITLAQLHHFAGNMLELINNEGKHILVMSEQAHSSLLPAQVQSLSKYATILSIPLFTIEKAGGGSARCMMAEIFLPLK